MSALIPALISLLQGQMGGGGGGGGGKPPKTPQEISDAYYEKLITSGKIYGKNDTPDYQSPVLPNDLGKEMLQAFPPKHGEK